MSNNENYHINSIYELIYKTFLIRFYYIKTTFVLFAYIYATKVSHRFILSNIEERIIGRNNIVLRIKIQLVKISVNNEFPYRLSSKQLYRLSYLFVSFIPTYICTVSYVHLNKIQYTRHSLVCMYIRMYEIVYESWTQDAAINNS